MPSLEPGKTTVLIVADDASAFEGHEADVAAIEDRRITATLGVPGPAAAAGAVSIPVRRGRLGKAARVIREDPASKPPKFIARALPPSYKVDKFLKRLKVDFVLVVGGPERSFVADVIQSSQAMGIPTRLVGANENWMQALEASAQEPAAPRRSPLRAFLRPLVGLYMIWWRLRHTVRLRTRLKALFSSSS